MFGDGTDFPDFFGKYGGSVVSVALDKYVYCIVKSRLDEKIYVNWSEKEIVDNVEEIKHELVREAMKLVGVTKGVEISFMSDVPAQRIGLGSSSAVTVGVLNALHHYKGELVSEERLAKEACRIEIDILGKKIGVEDQYIVANGGVKSLEFSKEGIKLNDIKMNEDLIEEFTDSVMLFSYKKTILPNQKEAKVSSKTRTDILKKMTIQARKAAKLLEEGDIQGVGKLLDERWKLGKELWGGVINPEIEELYKKALKAGAWGGKIAGAAEGGFLVLMVPRDNREDVRKVMAGYQEMEFGLSNEGSRVVFNVEKGLFNLRRFSREYFSQLSSVISKLDMDSMENFVRVIWNAYKEGTTVYFMGNGGSASIASHLAADIGKNVLTDFMNAKEKRFRTVALTDNIAWMTALANDVGYENVFVEQLKNFVKQGDVIVVVSSSGNSENVVRVAEWGKERGITVVGMIGFSGGRVKGLADVSVWVPVNHYGYVEGIHGDIHHYVVEALKQLKREESEGKR